MAHKNHPLPCERHTGFFLLEAGSLVNILVVLKLNFHQNQLEGLLKGLLDHTPNLSLRPHFESYRLIP